MTDTETIVDCPPTPPYPIYDSAHLLARIQALPAERKANLSELWTSNGLGALEGLVTADTYRAAERLVNIAEPTAPADFRHVEVAKRLDGLPEHIVANAWEAISVYAGTRAISESDLISVGRFAELERIVTEAVDYAATLEAGAIPSVTQLPVADDTGPLLASEDYPGPKADAKTVLAWVGDDRNRAARAYGREQERSTARKGVTAKLVEVLGPDGLAKVNEALAAAQPAPMDLGGGLEAATETSTDTPQESVGQGAEGDASGGIRQAPVEATPSAPTISADANVLVTWLDRNGNDVNPVAVALSLVSEALAALADALRKVA